MKEKIAVWISKRHGIPYRFRKSFVKRAFPRILSDYQFEINLNGVRYIGNTSDLQERNLLFLGGSDKHKISFMQDYAIAAKNENFIFLDIGANFGSHCLFMTKHCSEIHAFEPNPKVRESLNSKIYLNKIENITVHPIGLSDRNDRIPFFVYKNKGSKSGSFRSDYNINAEYFQDLDVRVGDELLQERNIKQADLIKVDVAGVEREVIEGLSETISQSRPAMIIELSDITRKSFGSKDDFESIFPSDYSFYKFIGTSRESSRYKLTNFDYNNDVESMDIIAVPKEKRIYIRQT